MRSVEKITDYLRLYPVRCVLVISFIVLFVVGVGCYYAGQQSTSRDINIQRVHTVERQLNNAGAELDEATRTNQSARNTVADGVIINERINDAVARSKESIERSESANRRSTDALTEAQQLVRSASATADENAKLIADSQRIIENARIRFEKGTSSGAKK